MKKIFLPLFAAVMLCGCCNIEYKGESRPALDSLTRVKTYYDENQLPKDRKYQTMGTLTASAGVSWTPREMELKIRKYAMNHGANGVFIQSIDRIHAGEARADQIENSGKTRQWAPSSDRENQRFFDESLTNYTKKTGSDEEVFQTVIKAKLIYLPVKPGEEDEE